MSSNFAHLYPRCANTFYYSKINSSFCAIISVLLLLTLFTPVNASSSNNQSCTVNWECSEWGRCNSSGLHSRLCTQSGCEMFSGILIFEQKPEELEECEIFTGSLPLLGAKDSSAIPKNLFDITFTLDDTALESSQQLSGVATFESFGTEPTPANLTFYILDSSGAQIYSKKENILVSTHQIFRWNYTGKKLFPAKYTALLTSLYGNNVYDEFRQGFEIYSVEPSIAERVLQKIENDRNFILLCIAILIIAFSFYRIPSARQAYRKNSTHGRKNKRAGKKGLPKRKMPAL